MNTSRTPDATQPELGGARETGASAAMDPALAVEDLHVALRTRHGHVHAVAGTTLEVKRGETLAVVGESGSGKSMTFLGALGLVQGIVPAEVTGAVRLDGIDLATVPRRERRSLLGTRVAMIFQNPLSALNPVVRVGTQLAETIRVNTGASRKEAWRQAVDALSLARIARPQDCARAYPHELSGGMRQRALIAMAIACRPSVLVADEPTTALDVTIQAEILDLLDALQRELNMGLILITHDLGLVARHADRVAVMYAGRVVEEAPVRELFAAPAHPYARALLESLPSEHRRRERLPAIPGEPPRLSRLPQGCPFQPRCSVGRHRERCGESTPGLDAFVEDRHRSACFYVDDLRARATDSGPDEAVLQPATPTSEGATGDTVLRVEGLVRDFSVRGARHRTMRAVDDVSFSLNRGETLGIVGESGSGKTTVARMLLSLTQPTSGTVWLEGRLLNELDAKHLRAARELMQVVFQDPQAALNPRMTVGASVAEPLIVHGQWQDDGPNRVNEMLKAVGLRPEHARRYPHEFSGGQQQRIGVARALILRPSVLILDEPTSALDVSIRAQIVNLLLELQATLGTSYIFIAHDLAIVNHVSDRIGVMYRGRMVEMGTASEVYHRPLHPYTQSLLSAIPTPVVDADHESAGRRALPDLHAGETNPVSGCPFHGRCPRATRIAAARAGSNVVSVRDRTLPVECVDAAPAWSAEVGHKATCHFVGDRG